MHYPHPPSNPLTSLWEYLVNDKATKIIVPLQLFLTVNILQCAKLIGTLNFYDFSLNITILTKN